MCRSNNDPDGPRSCSAHSRASFAKANDDLAAVDSSANAVALAEVGVVPDAPSASHLAEAEGSYSNVDRKERVNAMLEDLKGEIESLGNQQAWQDYLGTMSKFHNYSFRNQMLIALQTKGRAQRVAGFKKWKEFGRSVNKGSKAIHILAPRTIKDKEDLDDDGKPRTKVVGFTTVSVFADYQTSGDPLPSPPIVKYDRATGTAPAGMHSDMDSAISKHGFTVKSRDFGPNDSTDGYTDFKSKEVVINSRHSDAHQAAVKAHELAHIELGHGAKSAEYHSGPGGQRPTMEVEAESTAYVISRHYGLETKESFSYIDGWAKGNPDEVAKTAERVSAACDRILSATEK